MTMNMRNTLLLALLAVCGAANAVKVSELPTGQKVGNILDETLLVGGGATTAATPTLTIPRTDAGTNVVAYLLRLQRESSGTPAAGIGTGIEFRAETAAGNVETGATIEAVTTDVTATSEDFDLVFKTMAAGSAAAERARIKSTGTMLLGYGNSTDLALALVDSRGFYGGNGGLVFKNSVGNLWMAPSAAGTGVQITSDGQFAFVNSTTSAAGAPSSGFAYQAAGVIRVTDGSTQIRGLLGGGAAVASAAALPLPTGRVFHVTGTTTVTSITSTNFGSGVCVTLIFDGVLTFTDGSNLKLAGDFVTTADDTWSGCYDGTNWYESGRSVN